MKKFAIIVAGGKGLRMQTEIPKQFLELASKPVLMHSIDAFYSYDSSITCIVVLPDFQIDYWKNLCKKHNFITPHIITAGGAERFYSVQNGLGVITESGIVAIHDGVRPLVSPTMLHNGFTLAASSKSALPVINSIDSLRYISNIENHAISRDSIKRVQTPQFFDISILKNAYNQKYNTSFTDDASVWEQAGNTISCFDGDEKNIKITNPIDLIIAETLLQLE